MGTYKRLPRGKQKPKTDFVSLAEKFYAWFFQNWRVIGISALAAFLVLVAGIGISKYYKSKGNSAANEFVAAVKIENEGERYKALEDFTKKYQGTVSSREAMILLGSKSMLSGDYKTAVKWYEELFKQSGSYPVFQVYALHHLGDAYSKLGEWTNSAETYKKASEIRGNLIKPDSIFLQAQSLEKAGNTTQAEELYSKLVKGEFDSDTIIQAKSEERLLWLAAQKRNTVK